MQSVPADSSHLRIEVNRIKKNAADNHQVLQENHYIVTRLQYNSVFHQKTLLPFYFKVSSSSV